MEPEVEISWYSKKQAKLILNIYSESGEKLQTKTISSSQGLQSWVYDLSISEKLLKQASKKDDKLKEVKAADNGKFYLTKGSFKIELVMGGDVVSEKLVIE